MTKKSKKPSDGSGDGGGFRSPSDHIRHSIQDLSPALINMASNGQDAERSATTLSELMSSAFAARFGSDMTALKIRISFYAGERTQVMADLNTTRKEEADTDEWIPASYNLAEDGAKLPTETKWWRWQGRHKLEGGTIVLLLPAAMFASTITAHSNLIGTGLPIFLGENWLLPWTMAALVPMSGLAIKSMWHDIRSRRVKHVFSNILNSATFVSIGIWLWLFSDQFHGLSAGSSVGGLFDEPTPWEKTKETALVGVTLCTEVLITAVLAHRLDKIWERYSPNLKLRNHDSEVIQDREAHRLGQAVYHTDLLAELQGQVDAYEADLKLQIKLALLKYWERRARFDGPSN